MEKVIGIDLGTTNSLVAMVDEFTGKGECFPNSEGINLTASAVCFTNKEEPMIGNTAKDCAILYPEETATLFKRLMGVEKTAITVDGISYSPQQLSALILKSLKQDAETECEETVDKAVITVPAYFDNNRRQATMEAGEMAGLEVLDLLDEPVAVMYHVDAIRNYAGKTVLIFDLGGGTLDLVAVKVTEESIDEIAISGDLYCGGSDWDKEFVAYIKETYLKGVSLDAEAEQELVNKAEAAKKELSRKEETSFTVLTGSGRKEIQVTRSEFEACTAQWFHRAMKVLEEMKETLEGKGVYHLDQIILCGGATRMPQIQRGIKEIFPDCELLAKDVDQAVAKGAAIYAKALMTEKQPEIIRSHMEKTVKKLNRVTGRSYGIAVIIDESERKVCNMVYQNTELPVSEEETFYTRYDNQHQVLLEVFESTSSGRYEEIPNAAKLGECLLEIAGDLPKHSPIQVRLHLQENGTLILKGYETSGNTQVKAELQTKALLSPHDLVVEKAQVDDVYEKAV